MKQSHDNSGRRNAGRHDDAAIRGEPPLDRVEADSRIDAVLREVSPRGIRRPGLVELFSDDAIDRLLRDVPCRMESVRPFAAPGGRRVESGRDAAFPRLGRRPVGPAAERPARPNRLVRSAIRISRDALNVVAVLSVIVSTFAASVVASRWLSQPVARGVAIPPHRLDFSGSAAARVDPVVGVIAGRKPLESPGSYADDPEPISEGRGADTTADVASGSRSGGDGPVNASIGTDEAGVRRAAPLRSGPLPEVRAAPVSSGEAGRWAGEAGRKPSRPAGDSLQVVVARPAIGRSVPHHRGYDLAFEMTSGEAPFVDPSLTPALAVDAPPLTRRTDSFDRVERLLAVGGVRRDRLRQAVVGMRVEEVLAAVRPAATPSPAVPPSSAGAAAAAPSISLAGGASISGRPNARLLEVSIAAPRSSLRPAGNLVFVLDASAAAGADEVWPAICRGVEDAILRLDPAASITVVAFAERPVVIASGVPAREMIDVRRRLIHLRPRGGGDLHGCMAMVRGMTAAYESPSRCVVVAHAGSIARAERDEDPDLAAWRRSQQMVREGNQSKLATANAAVGRDAGSAMDVVEIDAVSGATGQAAERNGASLVEGVGLDSMVIRRSIVAAALGSDAPPGFQACRLEVAFDPAQVAGYRLVGHRRRVVEMASSQPSAVDLADGEVVRVLYEVVLRERDPSGRSGASPRSALATATCRYRRPGEASESRAVAGITASQLAVDSQGGDRSVELVWLAVAIAELAAGSAHVESPQRLREAVRLRFERGGDGAASSTGGDPAAEAGSMLRVLRDIWNAL